VRQQIASAVDAVIQLTRFNDGTRRLMSLMEINGVRDGMVDMTEIFRFDHQGTDPDGRTLGQIVTTGNRPNFLDHFELGGISYPEGLFEKRPVGSEPAPWKG